MLPIQRWLVHMVQRGCLRVRFLCFDCATVLLLSVVLGFVTLNLRGLHGGLPHLDGRECEADVVSIIHSEAICPTLVIR